MSTGGGFVGWLSLGDPEHYMDPTKAYTSPRHQQVDFSNLTARGAVGVYCTLERHQVRVTVTVTARVGLRLRLELGLGLANPITLTPT